MKVVPGSTITNTQTGWFQTHEAADAGGWKKIRVFKQVHASVRRDSAEPAHRQFSQCFGLGDWSQVCLVQHPTSFSRSALTFAVFVAVFMPHRLCSGCHVTLGPFPCSCPVMDVLIVDASFDCPCLAVFAFLPEQVLRHAER